MNLAPHFEKIIFDHLNPGFFLKNYQELYNYPKESQNSKKKVGFRKVGVQVHTHVFQLALNDLKGRHHLTIFFDNFSTSFQ